MKGKASASPTPSGARKKLGLSFKSAARKVVLAEKVFGTINKGSDRDNHVRVCVRMRPMNAKELEEEDSVAWKVQNNTLEEYDSDGIKNAQQFSFDHVWGPGIDTHSIYGDATKELVEKALSGINGTCFAYGQTSSGKTHTLMGSPEDPGITPLAIQDVFQTIEEYQTTKPNTKFLVRVSYIEIYNEEIKDLLVHHHHGGKKGNSKRLFIVDDTKMGPYIKNVNVKAVKNTQEVISLMKQGEKHRHFGSTNMNAHSSRSHTIFKMIIESADYHSGSSGDGGRKSLEDADSVVMSQLNLVDLAGSERAERTGARGKQLREGGNINKSLLTLATVIHKLSEGKTKHIPFRDSKLTRLLSSSLGGNARTCVVRLFAVEVVASLINRATHAF